MNVSYLSVVAVFVLAWVAPARADTPTHLAAYAVVRIPSHGASATVIETGPGRSLLLGCAHAFKGPKRTARIWLDVPSPKAGPARPGNARLLAIDYQLDLSIVELNDGPLPYVCPVAESGHRFRRLLSVGYDQMRMPAQQQAATWLGADQMTLYTREPPVEGRSGGALLDPDAGVLIGVVQAYEIGGQRRGMYVSHAAIMRFLAQHSGQRQTVPLAPQWQQGQQCPGGVCPLPRH